MSNPAIFGRLSFINDTIPDHADALATILETAAKRIRKGSSAEEIACDLLPIVRVAARRT